MEAPARRKSERRRANLPNKAAAQFLDHLTLCPEADDSLSGKQRIVEEWK